MHSRGASMSHCCPQTHTIAGLRLYYDMIITSSATTAQPSRNHRQAEFFIEHSDKLDRLLSSVTDRRRSITTPDTYLEYFDLRETIVSLIGEVRQLNASSSDAWRWDEFDERALIDRITAVEWMAADWDGAVSAHATTAASRKRSRTAGEDEIMEEAPATKREKAFGLDDMEIELTLDSSTICSAREEFNHSNASTASSSPNHGGYWCSEPYCC